MPDVNSKTTSPFHRGEQEIQTRVGKREAMEKFGRRVITSFMPDQHRDFYAQLPFFVAGSIDKEGWPWASILSGKPGFLYSPDPETLNINTRTISNDPLRDSIRAGAPLGLLGIDLSSRRRNRINARVSEVNADGFAAAVDQAFGNCPQYIQIRSVDFIRDPEIAVEKQDVKKFTNLDADAKKMIEAADTFFVSSFLQTQNDAEKEGVDVSHRGGRPGFVKVEGNTLTIPDYPGNYHFNTLGNFLLNPKAGLIFIDFDSGDLLMLTGTVELLWEDDKEVTSFKGAERAWRFTLDHGLKLTSALPFRSTLKEYSPNSLITGDWQQAQATRDAEKRKNAWRTYEVTRVEDESSVIRSFYLKPTDEDSLNSFQAGQFITIRVTPDATKKCITRTYTVSSAPDDNYYRISVKRDTDGLVSNYLHESLKRGDKLVAKTPLGEFFIDATESRPAVLLAGGVGITPMISMAQHIMNHGILKRHIRPLHIFHSAQTTEQRAFMNEFKALEQKSQGAIHYYSFISKPAQHDEPGKDYNGAGRITADALRQTLPLDDYDFFLCGPPAFMQSLYDTLTTLGVNDKRIFAESFGPAVLKREQVNQQSLALNEADSAIISFTKAGFQQAWNKGDGTILEVAENHGLAPNFSCRNGVCGACAVPLKSGSVAYRSNPVATHGDDEVLICCAVPAEHSEAIELEL
jgi:ferredoxin-NADP reductase/predicted pyridoxine 5'-phosphate oxidase superfamily flavin-nucleotide-binding protein